MCCLSIITIRHSGTSVRQYLEVPRTSPLMGGERTSESTENADDVTTEHPGEQYDDRAEEFLELEAALSNTGGSASALGDANTVGVLTEAKRVPPASVPEAYPVEIETTHALLLTVLLDTNREITVYTEWPDHISNTDPLVRLLARLDLDPSRFADIAGEEVPLEHVGGQYVLDLPATPVATDHSPYWVWGIAAGLALWIIIWLFVDLIGGGVIILAWILLPVLTYFDMRYVDATSDWDPNRYLWPLLAAIWIINIPARLFYIYKRVQALGPFWQNEN